MKKYVVMISFVLILAVILTGCSKPTNEQVQIANAKMAANSVVSNQPVPTDMEYSLERYNVIRRAYWVNGQREKAMSYPCAIERPLGYIVLFSDNGSIVGRFIVDGKISSLNSYLFPAYETQMQPLMRPDGIYTDTYHEVQAEIAGIDGMYGSNITGIFFFTTDGKYVEWTGDFLYSDIPFEIEDPVLRYEEGQ